MAPWLDTCQLPYHSWQNVSMTFPSAVCSTRASLRLGDHPFTTCTMACIQTAEVTGKCGMQNLCLSVCGVASQELPCLASLGGGCIHVHLWYY
jgi:hypothetical protein